jgi:hypothetical protein
MNKKLLKLNSQEKPMIPLNRRLRISAETKRREERFGRELDD